MRFDTYIPCDILKPYIKCFAVSESTEEGAYKVLPDIGVVIGFQYKGALAVLSNEREIQLSSSGLTGIQDRFSVFKNTANIGTLLVYFKETGANAFLSVPLHEVFGKSISLDNLMRRSELLVAEEKLYGAQTDQERIRVVEQFLISGMKLTNPDSLVLAALTLIHRSKGNIRIKELMEHLNISQSPLEKRFRRVVGASPKKFASIVRLNHIIKDYNRLNTLTEQGYEAGFYDQSHFIKEFKNFTGETPESFFFPE